MSKEETATNVAADEISPPVEQVCEEPCEQGSSEVVEDGVPCEHPKPAVTKKRVRVATTWLDGCSGCHMSLLDIDEKLADVAQMIDLVYGPLVDFKEFPEAVDVTLVEGAVSSEEDAKKARLIRDRSYLVVSFGDCAVTANVPGMRNQFKIDDVLQRAYVENASLHPGAPTREIPHLLPRARPVHEIVNVDVFLPGCPPPPEAILYALSELLEGRIPDLTGKTRFGA
jgi:NAD-reducing hydrogenase small subunit